MKKPVDQALPRAYFSHMATIAPRWAIHSTFRGITICKREQRTGTACGSFLAAGLYFSNLKQCREYLSALPEGYFCGPNQIVSDALSEK